MEQRISLDKAVDIRTFMIWRQGCRRNIRSKDLERRLASEWSLAATSCAYIGEGPTSPGNESGSINMITVVTTMVENLGDAMCRNNNTSYCFEPVSHDRLLHAQSS